jgi:hypothetical protein
MPRVSLLYWQARLSREENFGSWVLGDCHEPYSYGGHMNGKGTSKVNLRRVSENSYFIEATNGSKGRLWRTDDNTKPIDEGLFEMAFAFRVQYQ